MQPDTTLPLSWRCSAVLVYDGRQILQTREDIVLAPSARHLAHICAAECMRAYAVLASTVTLTN